LNEKYQNSTFSVFASHTAGVAGTATTEAISLSKGDYFVVRSSLRVMTTRI